MAEKAVEKTEEKLPEPLLEAIREVAKKVNITEEEKIQEIVNYIRAGKEIQRELQDALIYSQIGKYLSERRRINLKGLYKVVK